MKTFHLTRMCERNHKYHVTLTWGKTFQFSRYRAALKFLTATNIFLTAFLVDLNSSYCEVELRYRRNWLLFFHDKPSMGFNVYEDERTCKKSIHAVEELLDLSFNHHQRANGSFYVFEDFRKCLDYLIEASRVLLKHYKKRTDTVNVWEIKILLSKLEARKAELDQWGTDCANKMEAKMTVAWQGEIPLEFTHKLSAVA